MAENDELQCNEHEMNNVIDYLKRFSDPDKQINKVRAYELLCISRATFDNYIKKGIIPKGRKYGGFKELRWSYNEIMKIKNQLKLKDNNSVID